MTLTINEGAAVFTADGERVGSVDRIVLDPVTKDVSHIVLRLGVPASMIEVIPDYDAEDGDTEFLLT